MRLLQRHIFYEVFVVSLTAVAVFVGILLAANVAKDAVEWVIDGRLTFLDVLEILCTLIPSAISYALPLGMMTGVLSAIGLMSSQNEILIMKSSGISLVKIVQPVLFLALIVSLFSTYINLFHAPKSANLYRNFFRKIVQTKPMRFLSPQIFNDYFPGYVIYADAVKAEIFENIRIWQVDEHDHLSVYIFSKSGKISFDEVSNTFSLRLDDGIAEKFNAHADDESHIPQSIYFKNIKINLPIEGIIGHRSPREKKLSHMTFPELLEAKAMLTEKYPQATYDEIRQKKMLINTQISSSIASAAGILVMALLGISLGMKTSRTETSINAVIALILCLGYYLISTIFSWFGDNAKLRPDILVWIPNIFLTILGSYLFVQASKH